MTLKMDVLPAPLRPMMPHRSPSATVKVMFLKSSVAPKEMPTLETERRVTQIWEKTWTRRERQPGCSRRNAMRSMKAKRAERAEISRARMREALALLVHLNGGARDLDWRRR